MFSVIIPLYNKQASIERCIHSILNQSNDDYEIVIVDDGSTDNSVVIVESICDNRIRLFKKQNGGPASARNYGVRNSGGNWVLFLDADDYLESGTLEHFRSLIQTYPNCEFFSCNHFIQNKGEKRIYSENLKEGYLRNSFYAWCTNNFMPRAGAALFSRNLITRFPMREDLRRYEDAEHLFALMRNTKVVQSKIPVMTYNCDTLEASSARKDIFEDFIGHLDPKSKSMWEQYALYQLLLQGYALYPNNISKLYRYRDFYTWKVRFAGFYLKHLRKYKLLRTICCFE